MAATANSWKVYSGKWKVKWFKKTASTAIASGILVESVAGYLVEATTTAGATDTPIVGIYAGPAITASSANYAATDYLPVFVPENVSAEAQGAVDTGSLAQTSVGLAYDISATNGVTVSTTTNNAVSCTKFISATLGLFSLTAGNYHAN